MTNEQANELFRTYKKTGDVAVRNELVKNYMYVAEILAKKFSGRGVEYDDLLQIASEALISCIDKFDPDMGNLFTTYVTPTITGIIRNYFRDYSRSVRIPRKLYALNTKVKGVVNEYYQANGVKPTVNQIASVLGESVEDVIEAMECHTPVSLDSTVQSEDSDVPLYEVIDGNDASFENFENSESLKSEIAKLSTVEKQIVSMRFVNGLSQSETGKRLGVNQMFVSRTERKIVEKLREAFKDD